MKFTEIIEMLNYQAFKRLFLGHSSREKKQLLQETGIGKVVRDDKIKKLHTLFLSNSVDSDGVRQFIERFFIQNAYYGNAALRDRVAPILIEFLDFLKVPHNLGMLGEDGVAKLKKSKAKNFSSFMKKHIDKDDSRFVFFVYSAYCAVEHGSKDIMKFVKDAPEFADYRN